MLIKKTLIYRRLNVTTNYKIKADVFFTEQDFLLKSNSVIGFDYL